MGLPKRLSDFVKRQLLDRREFLDRLRSESRRIRGSIDLSVLVALLVGKIDLVTDPQNPIADKLITELYYRHLHKRVELAVLDYLIAGLGGIGLNPFGVVLLRPENTVILGDWFFPDAVVRVFTMTAQDARERFFETTLPLQSETERDTTSVKVTGCESRLEPLDEEARANLYQELERALEQEKSGSDQPSEPEFLFEEVLTPEEFLYYYQNKPIARTSRRYWEGYYLLLGDERPLTNRADRKRIKQWNLPIGMIERLVGRSPEDFNLLKYNEDLLGSLLKYALRANAAAYRADLLDLESEDTREFLSQYRPIASLGEGAPVVILDRITMPEQMNAYELSEKVITAITGVTPYMLGQLGASELATEVIAMNTQSNIRTSYLQLRVQEWLDQLLGRFRQYLVNLDPSEQEEVMFVESPDPQNEPKARVLYVFGPARPYQLVLEGVQVRLATMGFQDQINRRNETQGLLLFLANLMPILAQQGVQYDLGKLTDRLLGGFGLDPALFRLSTNSALPLDSLLGETDSKEPTLGANRVAAPMGMAQETGEEEKAASLPALFSSLPFLLKQSQGIEQGTEDESF